MEMRNYNEIERTTRPDDIHKSINQVRNVENIASTPNVRCFAIRNHTRHRQALTDNEQTQT